MAADSGEPEVSPEEENAMTSPAEMTSVESEEMPAAPEMSGETAPAAPQTEGRRTQLRIVRENLQSLSTEVGRFRKSHEVSTKKLEAQVTSLRKDLAKHVRSKDLGVHVKSHEIGTKRLEKQIASLRSDLASLKSQMAKDAAKSRAREEAALSKIFAKVRAPAKKPQAKSSKKKR